MALFKRKKEKLIDSSEAMLITTKHLEDETKYREEKMTLNEKIRHRAKLGVRNCLYTIHKDDTDSIIKLCRMNGFKTHVHMIKGDHTTLEISW